LIKVIRSEINQSSRFCLIETALLIFVRNYRGKRKTKRKTKGLKFEGSKVFQLWYDKHYMSTNVQVFIMQFFKNKDVLFSLFLAMGLVLGVFYVSADDSYYEDSELINMSELSETDIDQMAAVLAKMQTARQNIE